MYSLYMHRQVTSSAVLLARLEWLEARVVEIEQRLEHGSANEQDRAELVRLQAEAEFYHETLEQLGVFNPSEELVRYAS